MREPFARVQEASQSGTAWRGAARIGAHATVRSSIIGPGATIGDHCHLDAGVVLGEGVRLGAGNVLSAGAKVSPGVELPEAALRF